MELLMWVEHLSGEAWFLLGNNKIADDKFQQALKLAKQIESPHGELNNLGSLGNLYFREGKNRQAEEKFLEAEEKFLEAFRACHH